MVQKWLPWIKEVDEIHIDKLGPPAGRALMDPGFRRFAFASGAMPEAAFEVLGFEGEEGLCRCYRFVIDLAGPEAGLDPGALLAAPATFTILRPDGDLPFHGVLACFEQLDQAQGRVLCRATLVPRLWRLSLTRDCRVYLGLALPERLRACLEAGGLAPGDLELRLQETCEPREFACQYNESHLDCFSRWAEHHGLTYWFEQGRDAEKLVVTDHRLAHGAMPQGEAVRYRPPSGPGGTPWPESVFPFHRLQTVPPETVVLKDWNGLEPGLDLTVQAGVRPGGLGQVHLYGEHYRTLEEGERLARIRAEERLCRERRYRGETTVPFLRPGYVFELRGHEREADNQRYLTVGLRHRGSQVVPGLPVWSVGEARQPHYQNSVEAIPASVQFRPGRGTPRPRILGCLPARVDGEGSGRLPELDEHGRYKVVLGFDRSGRRGGKASAWLRLLQPYAGSGHGLHLPLRPGTEVMVAFEDGDPDRPVIAGAVPNPGAPSVVDERNASQLILQSAAGNRLLLDDQPGQERILLECPAQGSSLRIGAPPAALRGSAADGDPGPAGPFHPVGPHSDPENPGIFLATSGLYRVEAATKTEECDGMALTTILGSKLHLVVLAYEQIVVGRSDKYSFPRKWSFSTPRNRLKEAETQIGGVVDSISANRKQLSQLWKTISEQQRSTAAGVGYLRDRVYRVGAEVVEDHRRVDHAIANLQILSSAQSRSEVSSKRQAGRADHSAGSASFKVESLVERGGKASSEAGSERTSAGSRVDQVDDLRVEALETSVVYDFCSIM